MLKLKNYVNLKKKKKQPKVINLFGSSGSGKSTTALGLTYYLRLLGYKAEYVSEYAKDLVVEESEHKLKHQLYVFAKQLKRVDVLLNKDIDYIITDSPTLLSYFYGEKFQVNLDGFKELVVSSFKSTPQISVFLRRTLPFDETLRLQTSEESDNDSEVLERILNELNVPYTTFLSNNETVSEIIKLLEKKDEN